MNFFEHQEKAKKKTFWLVLYFIIAIVCIILFIDIVFASAIIYAQPEHYFKTSNVYTANDAMSNLNQNAIINLMIGVTFIVSPVIILVIFIGTLWKMFSLRDGGIAVAQMVQAQPISPSTTNFLEKRFINIVEEMSIASGVQVPKLFVMQDKAINAFVAGIKPDDTVMVVTQGALEQLTRDELQSVVGHEFSHILNSDMQISVKLMGILGGLLLIGQAGYFMLRILGSSNRRSSSSSDKKGSGNIVVVILIIGLGLLILGYIGLFFGRLIKAAVSRQRELLADASSVQFTRNPQGLVFALRRILESEKGTYLSSKNVEDISHLCFCTPRWTLFQSLLATHPPLEKRIALLDPQGQYKDLPLKNLTKDQTPTQASSKEAVNPMAMMGAAVLASSVIINPQAVAQSIGNPTQTHVNIAKELIAQIPDPLKLAAHEPQKVQLLYYALILSYHDSPSAFLQNEIIQQLGDAHIQEILSYEKMISSASKLIQLPLIDISLAAFKNNDLKVREKIYENCQALSELGEKHLFEFTLLTLIKKATQPANPKVNATKYTSFKEVLPQISQLLSIILKAGAKNEAEEDSDFATLMKNFSDTAISRPQVEIDPIKLQETLITLSLLSPACKEKLINVLLACIAQDNKINIPEAELIRAIAATLDCPIPPIVASV